MNSKQYQVSPTNFYIIFSGVFPPNPVELLSKAKFKDFKRDDCLALAALQISFDFIETRLSRSLGDEQVEQLAELDSKLDQYLNQLD